MLTQRAEAIARFTRNDAVRFAIAAGILIAGPHRDPRVRDPAAADAHRGGRATSRRATSCRRARCEFTSDSQTAGRAGRGRQGRRPPSVRLHHREGRRDRRRAAATRSSSASRGSTPRSRPRSRRTSAPGLLQVAVPGLTDAAQATLLALDPAAGRCVRTESARDPRRAAARRAARQRRAGDPDAARRAHGRRPRRRASGRSPRELIGPLVVRQLLVQPGADRPGEGARRGRPSSRSWSRSARAR